MRAMYIPEAFPRVKARAFICAAIFFNTLAPFLVWLQTSGNPIDYIRYSLPAGQILYVMSKLCGLYAVALLTTQVVVALAKSPQRSRQGVLIVEFFELFPLHRYLGICIVCLMLAHASLFVAAASMRSGQFTGHALTLNFTSGYYELGVSLGVLALLGTIVVGVSGAMLRLGWQRAKSLHWLALPVLLLVMVHSVMIGSETGYAMVKAFYGFAFLLVIVTFLWRFKKSIFERND